MEMYGSVFEDTDDFLIITYPQIERARIIKAIAGMINLLYIVQ